MKNNHLLFVQCCSIAFLINIVIYSFRSSEIPGLTVNAQTNPVSVQNKPEASTLWSFGTLLLLPLHIIEACAITVLFLTIKKSKREQDNSIKTFKEEHKKLEEELKAAQKKLLESDTKLHKIEKSLISSAAANTPKPAMLFPESSPNTTPMFASPVITEFAQPPEIIKSNYQFLDSYNHHPDKFTQQYSLTIVSEYLTNIDNRRTDNSTDIILSENHNGNYWLVKEDDITYLIPRSKVKIQSQNIPTIRGLFDFSTFNSDYSSFKVLKPAIVSVQFMADGLKWKVEQKGELKFI